MVNFHLAWLLLMVAKLETSIVLSIILFAKQWRVSFLHSFSILRERLRQSLWKAAHRPAVIPSVLWYQARAEALHRVHGRRGKIFRLLLLLCHFFLLFSPFMRLFRSAVTRSLCGEGRGKWRLASCLRLAVAWGHGRGGCRGWSAT